MAALADELSSYSGPPGIKERRRAPITRAWTCSKPSRCSLFQAFALLFTGSLAVLLSLALLVMGRKITFVADPICWTEAPA